VDGLLVKQVLCSEQTPAGSLCRPSARKEGTEDIFGFDRLEALLAKNAHLGVERLRDAVLGEVERFSGHAPREDDQTILVLRLP
jgi:hypothetical protein